MSATHQHHASTSDGAASPRSFFQYLDILRDRWKAAAIAFVIVAGLVVVHALFSTPTYASHAMIQLDMKKAGGDRIAEISLLNDQANVDAELEVMRSYSVARDAAIHAGAGAILREKNGWRPWESLVRGKTGGGEPTRLDARLLDRPMPARGGTFRLTFDEAGTHVTVAEAGSDEAQGTVPFDAARGARLEIAGEKLEITPVKGAVAGRTFLLRLRTEREAALWVQEMVKAKQVGTYTGIVYLGAEADGPYLAQRMAAALSQSYREHKKVRKTSQMQKRVDWLTTQLEEQDKLLKTALDARDEYIRTHGAILLSEQATAAFEAQSKLFEQRLQQEQILMQEGTALDALHETKTPDRVMAAIGATNVDPQTQAIADNLVQLEVRRGSLLRQRSTTEDPAVKRLDAEITEVRTMLSKRIEALRSEVEAQIKRRIAAVNNRLKQIQDEVVKHDAVLKKLPAEERALAEKTRNVEAARTSSVFLKQMKGESELALSSTLTQAHEVDPALLLTARQSPVLFRRALVAFFLGLFAAIGMALFRHLRDRTVQSPRDLEEGLGVQLYASIPEFKSVPRRQRLGLKSSLVVRDVPNSTLTENYRTLRANIRFADTGEPIQALAITSALPSEGKTVTTLNLAVAMAKAGNAVIVVDADLRRPMVDTHLGGQPKPGTVEILRDEIDWRSAVQQSDVENLAFIPAGRQLKNPGALLESGTFEKMLKELRETYEYVLFDVPPVLAVADAAAFFRRLDAVFLVSRQGACPLDIVAGAYEQVQRFGGNVQGAIFNGFDAKRAGSRRYGYGGYYGYYGYHAYHGYYAQPEKDDRRQGGGEDPAASRDAETIKKA